MRLRRSLVGALAILTLVGCYPRRVATPEDRAFHYAVEATSRLRQFQSTVIAANKLGQIPDAAAISIVRFTGTSVQLIEQTPFGWALPVKGAYDQLVKTLPPNVLALYKPTLDALSALLDVILKGPQVP